MVGGATQTGELGAVRRLGQIRRHCCGSLQPLALLGLFALVAALLLLRGASDSLGVKARQQAAADAAALGSAGVQAAILDLNAGVNTGITLMHIAELSIGTGGLMSAVGLCLSVVGCPEGLMVAAQAHDIVREMLMLSKQLADARDHMNRFLAPALVLSPPALAAADLGAPVAQAPFLPSQRTQPAAAQGSCMQMASDPEPQAPTFAANSLAGSDVQVDWQRKGNAHVVRAMLAFPDLLFGGGQPSHVNDDSLRAFNRLSEDLQTLLQKTLRDYLAKVVLPVGTPNKLSEHGAQLAAGWLDLLSPWFEQYQQASQAYSNLPSRQALEQQILANVEQDYRQLATSVDERRPLGQQEQQELAAFSLGNIASSVLSGALQQLRVAASNNGEQKQASAAKRMFKMLLAGLLCGGSAALEKLAGPDGMAKPTVLPADFWQRQYLIVTTGAKKGLPRAVAEARPDSPVAQLGEPILWPGFAAELAAVDLQRRLNLSGSAAGALDALLKH